MIRALVQPDHGTFGVAITIVDQVFEEEAFRTPARILRLAPRGGDEKTARCAGWEDVGPNEPFEPTLVLGDELARPLLDALCRHYSGAEDTRALRRDYDGERKRVDLLIGHLGLIAKTLAEPQP